MTRAAANSCDIHVVEAIDTGFTAFALRKGSPWKESISNLIRKYKESDIIDNIEKKHSAAKCIHEKENHKQFGILYLSGACILLVFGVLISIVISFIEHLINALSKKLLKDRVKSSSLTNDAHVKDIEDL